MTHHTKLIVVLFTGHVGSTWFTSLLADHPNICQIGFEPVDDLTEMGLKAKPYFERVLTGEKPDSFPGNVAKTFQKKTKSPHDTPKNAWGIDNREECQYFVFKTRLNLSLQLEFFRDWLPDEKPVLILLRRRNKIKNAISQYKRTQLKVSHLENLDQTTTKLQPIVVDPAYILRQATQFTLRELRCKHYYAYLNEKFGINGIEIYYEDLLSIRKRMDFFDSLFRSLGLPNQHLHSGYEKITSNVLPEAVSNFSELAELISTTDFALYLDDDDFDIVEEIYSGRLKFQPALDDVEVQHLERLRSLLLLET